VNNLDIKNKIEENQSILFPLKAIDHDSYSLGLIKTLAGKKICYVSLNRTYHSLENLFMKFNIDTKNIFYLDGISNSVKETKSENIDKCHFVTFPEATKSLIEEIGNFLEKGGEYIVFDSVTDLLIFNSRGESNKLTLDILDKVKENKSKIILIALKGERTKDFIEQVRSVVDDIIE
jgi:hypothetical protein